MRKLELTKFFTQVIKFSPSAIFKINRFQNWLWRLVPKNKTLHTILMIPNLLSLFRLIALLVFFSIGFLSGANKWFYLIVYLALMLLDLIDGPIARQTGTVSKLGMFLDPLADKVCHLSVILVAVGYGLIPVWFLFFSLIKEIFTGLICGYRHIGSARWFAKTSSLIELLVFLLVFFILIPNWVFIFLVIIQILVLMAYAVCPLSS